MIQLKLCSDFVLGKLEVKDEMNKDDPFPENIQGNCTLCNKENMDLSYFTISNSFTYFHFCFCYF